MATESNTVPALPIPAAASAPIVDESAAKRDALADSLRRTLKFPNLSEGKGKWSAVTHKRPFIYTDADGSIVVARPTCDADKDAPEHDEHGRLFRGIPLSQKDADGKDADSGLCGVRIPPADIASMFGEGCTPAMFGKILTMGIVSLFSGGKGGVVVRDQTGARVAGKSNGEADALALQIKAIIKALPASAGMDAAMFGMIVAHVASKAAELAKLADPDSLVDVADTLAKAVKGKRAPAGALLAAYQTIGKALGDIPAAAVDADDTDADAATTPAATTPAV